MLWLSYVLALSDIDLLLYSEVLWLVDALSLASVLILSDVFTSDSLSLKLSLFTSLRFCDTDLYSD